MDHRSAARTFFPYLLGDILPAPGRVMMRCGVLTCLNIGVLEVDCDLHAYLKRVSLARLETALRCTCGGRWGSLEPWPAGLDPPPPRGRLFLFVV